MFQKTKKLIIKNYQGSGIIAISPFLPSLTLALIAPDEAEPERSLDYKIALGLLPVGAILSPISLTIGGILATLNTLAAAGALPLALIVDGINSLRHAHHRHYVPSQAAHEHRLTRVDSEISFDRFEDREPSSTKLIQNSLLDAKAPVIHPIESAYIGLNGTQRTIIDSTLIFLLDDIKANLTRGQATKAFQALLANTWKKEDIELWQEKTVLDSLGQIHTILTHPYPQNRFHGDGNAFWHQVLKGQAPTPSEEREACATGVFKGIVYYYQSGFGSKIMTEPQGILGLSSRNDPNNLVTQQNVVEYIQGILRKEIIHSASTSIQLWYKQRRDENKVLSLIENKEESLLAHVIHSRR